MICWYKYMYIHIYMILHRKKQLASIDDAWRKMGSFDPTVSRYRYVQVPIWPVPDRSDVRNLQFTTSYIILVSAQYYAFVFLPFLVLAVPGISIDPFTLTAELQDLGGNWVETHAFRKMTPVNNESDIVRPSFTLGDPPIFVISKANPNPSLTLTRGHRLQR